MELHQDALLTTVGNETLRDDRVLVDCWYFSSVDTLGGPGSGHTKHHCYTHVLFKGCIYTD